MSKTTSLIAFFVLLKGLCTAQDNLNLVSSAGRVDSNNSIQLEWSLGEVSINSHVANLRLSEGFHQPKYAITSINTESPLNELKISPNPTTGFLHMDGLDLKDADLQLHRVDGTTVKSKINGQMIDLSGLSTGIYILTVYQNKQHSSFKIIKH